VSEPEHFLSRWARLKREAAETPEADAPDAVGDEARPPEPASEANAPCAAEPAFDISALPPIESITATTDIRAFLAPGVPRGLARAALRRAWVADPTIREFVGIAENQWDFNDPNAIPGFGSLGPLDVRRLVAQMLGEPQRNPEQAVVDTEKGPAPGGQTSDSIAADPRETGATEGDLRRPEHAQQIGSIAETELGEAHAATQQRDADAPPSDEPDAPARRSHGGALPK
jgi:hypothetical protein